MEKLVVTCPQALKHSVSIAFRRRNWRCSESCSLTSALLLICLACIFNSRWQPTLGDFGCHPSRAPNPGMWGRVPFPAVYGGSTVCPHVAKCDWIGCPDDFSSTCFCSWCNLHLWEERRPHPLHLAGQRQAQHALRPPGSGLQHHREGRHPGSNWQCSRPRRLPPASYREYWAFIWILFSSWWPEMGSQIDAVEILDTAKGHVLIKIVSVGVGILKDGLCV